jgi:hypothetical protein
MVRYDVGALGREPLHERVVRAIVHREVGS